MRILILTPEFPPDFGGIGTHCHEMAKHWSNEAEVTVLALTTAQARARGAGTFELVTVRTATSRAVRLWRWVREIRRLIAAEPFDVVYVGHWRSCGVAYRIAAARCERPPHYVQAIHGAEVLYLVRSRRKALMRGLFRWTVAPADRLVALGEYQAGLLDQLGILRDRVFVSPEGVDPSQFQKPDTEEAMTRIRERHGLEGRRVMLTVARLAPHKGHDMVIRALPAILSSVPDAVYLVVGSGSNEAPLRRLAAEVGVAQHVRFAGFVPEHDLATYYYLCDLFIMPSRELDGDTEGFGIVFAEAAACGKPTIGGRTGGILEAIQEGHTGVLVEPTSTAEIAEAATRLLSNDDLARRMGEAGRQRVLQHMQYRDIARNILRESCAASAVHGDAA